MNKPVGSLETEQALLGAIMLNNEAFGAVCDILKPEDFTEPLHRHIYEIASRAIVSGLRVDPLHLAASLPKKIGDVDTRTYLTRLASETPSITDARSYARILRDLRVTRQLALIAGELQNAPDFARSPSAALEKAWADIDAIRLASEEVRNQSEDLAQSMSALVEEIDEVRQGKRDPGIATGIPDLDELLGGGLRRGRLYVIAGRPGMGKTVIGAAMARWIARRNHGVKFHSLEIDQKELSARIVAADIALSGAPASYRDIMFGRLDDRQFEAVLNSTMEMRSWPMRMDCSAGLTMAQIETRGRLDAERMKAKGQSLDVIIIDYLGLITPSERYAGNQTIELGETTKAAKNLSKTLNCAVVLLCQLNRGVEGRENKRPTLADLRQSGRIEEDADGVFFCYRPSVYLERQGAAGDANAAAEAERRENEMHLIVDKNRHGRTGECFLEAEVGKNHIVSRSER
jgi:replicative DNA helicase